VKIALVYPRFDWFEYNGLAEPLGLLQLVSVLRTRGHDPVFLDYSFCKTIDELDGLAGDAGMIGVAISAAAKLDRAAVVSKHLRSVNPDAIFVVGGAYPSIFPHESILETGADYALTGEAEESLVELADRLEEGRDPSDIRNLVFRKPDGTFVDNPRRPVPPDIDAVPYTARDVVDYDSYL